MDAAVEITVEGIDPGHLDGARILLGDTELGRLEGRTSVRFTVPAGRHVLLVKDGYGMSAASKFHVQSRQCARLILRHGEPEGWGLVFGGFHALRRAGTGPLDEG